jgi:hypothetical protein
MGQSGGRVPAHRVEHEGDPLVAERGGELRGEVRLAEDDGVGPQCHQLRRQLGAAHQVQGAESGLPGEGDDVAPHR